MTIEQTDLFWKKVLLLQKQRVHVFPKENLRQIFLDEENGQTEVYFTEDIDLPEHMMDEIREALVSARNGG